MQYKCLEDMVRSGRSTYVSVDVWVRRSLNVIPFSIFLAEILVLCFQFQFSGIWYRVVLSPYFDLDTFLEVLP